MPTISIKKKLLDKHLFNCYSFEELDEIFFSFGLEIDSIVEEIDSFGEIEEIYKIEIPANRYDLLCVEGLCQALINAPKFKISNVKNFVQIFVESETKNIRPYAAGAILRGVKFTKDLYSSFIDLQDKLHQNICRKRSLVAIGTHDLDKFKGNVRYCAMDPEKITFQPLNQNRSYNGIELMNLYSDSYLREYLSIIKDKKLYPVFLDENNDVLSLPPIINSEKTKITFNTTNIFIEATGVNYKKLEIVIDTIVTMFSQYCLTPFIIEPVIVLYDNGTSFKYPILKYRQIKVDLKKINLKIGVCLNTDDAIRLLQKMGHSAVVLNDFKLMVTIPPTRHDILHECDIAEDLALAYGFNNIIPNLPESNTVAVPFILNKLTDSLRLNISMCGWTEVLNFSLCSIDDISKKLRKDNILDFVKISNPKTTEFQAIRNTLLHGILKTIASNKDMPIPLKLFEIQDVVFKSIKSETKCKNKRFLCAVYCSKTGGFEIIHGLLDRIMHLLNIQFIKNSTSNFTNKYFIMESSDSSYFDGRCAKIFHDISSQTFPIGKFGILHPDVLANFNISMPCTALEIDIEHFL